MKRLLLALCWGAAAVCLTTHPAAADVAEADTLPRCGGELDLCGYVERGTEAELIPQRFERAFPFSEGLAAVRIEGRFGFIDLTGAVVIEPQFDLAGDFYQGLAEVLVGDVVGVIDRSGRIVVEPQFARAVPFTADTLLVAEGDWRSGYFSGFEKLEGLSSLFLPGRQRFGLYHITRGWITEPRYIVRVFEDAGRGLIWATTEEEYGGPYGLLRADGTWQVEPAYSYGQPLSEGRAIVRGPSPGRTFTHDGREIDPSGAVDEYGTLVVSLQFSLLSSWSGRYAVAQQDGRYGLVALDGHLLAGRYFDEVGRAETGQLPRVRDGETWYSVEETGALVPDQNEGALIASCPSGLAIREVAGRAQFSHSNLEEPIPLLFDRRYMFSRVDCESPVPVSLNDKWGYVTQEGAVIADPPSFDTTYGFQDGVAAVSLNGAWGLIDEMGAFVVAPIYDELRPDEGLYRAVQDEREFWIDARGREVPEPSLTLEERARFLDCPGGGRLFADQDLWGLMNADGAVVIAPEYRALTCFSQGVAWAAGVDATSWCAIDPDGRVRDKPECRETHYPHYITHHYPEPFAEDPYESSVLWVRAFLDFARGQRDAPPIWIGDGVMSSGTWSIISP